MLRFAALALCVVSWLGSGLAFAGKTENVVLIVSDGLRWQEVFTGADPRLISDKTGGNWVSEADLRKRYWRADAETRRGIVVSLPVGHGCQARSDFRQSTQGQRRARHQWQGVLLSRIQRNVDRLSQ